MKSTTRAAIAAFGVVLSGCARSSDEVASSYISPLAYETYTCPQLAGELQRINARVHEVAGDVDAEAKNDKIAMGVGVVIFWPALFMLKGNGPEHEELARLKGEYDAVNQEMIKDSCDSTMATQSQIRPSANMHPYDAGSSQTPTPSH